MTIREQITYVTKLLSEAVLSGNWEAASRFTFVLSLLRKDLILEQEQLILNLRRAG